MAAEVLNAWLRSFSPQVNQTGCGVIYLEHLLREQSVPEGYLELAQISEALGHLPLALDQMASFVLETGCTIASFQRIYSDWSVWRLHHHSSGSCYLSVCLFLRQMATEWFFSSRFSIWKCHCFACADVVCGWRCMEHSFSRLGFVVICWCRG